MTMNVKDVMTPSPETVRADESVEKAAAIMKSLGVGALPVGDDSRVSGIVTDRDIAVRCVADGLSPKQTPVSDIMTRDVVSCFEDENLRDAVHLMEEKQIRRLIVCGRDQTLSGILSLADVAVRCESRGFCADAIEQISKPAQPQR